MSKDLAGTVGTGSGSSITTSKLGYWPLEIVPLSLKVAGVVENYKALQLKYDGSWRKMWLLRPRVRTDGKI